MTCFECQGDEAKGMTLDAYFVCWSCVRAIVRSYIQDRSDREAHIEQSAGEVADKLGFQLSIVDRVDHLLASDSDKHHYVEADIDTCKCGDRRNAKSHY